MLLLADILKKEFPDFNKRIHTLLDARNFVHRLRVNVVEDPDEDWGYYEVRQGVNTIVINPYLPLGWYIWVLWHELFHVRWHAPETSYFSVSMSRKNDFEANYSAAIILLPQNVIHSKTIDEIVLEYALPKELVEIRKFISDNEGQ